MGDLLVIGHADAAVVVDRLAAALLVLAIGALLLRDLAAGIWALAVQSLVLVAIGGVLALSSGQTHAWIAAGLTLAVKVVVVPLVLRAALERVKLRREVSPVLPDRVVVVIGVGLAMIGYYAAGPLHLPTATSTQALPVGIGLMLIGLLMMVVRRKALSQVMGLLTLENGIYLTALVATEGLPLAVELAVAFDLLVAVLLMAIVAGQISRTFETINTDQLRRLRDHPARMPPR